MENTKQAAPKTLGIEDDDSEWEYEYHETETETFYMTFDISSESSNIKPTRQPKAPKNPAKRSPEAPVASPKNLPTNGRWGYAQAASRTQRSIQNIRTLRSSQTSGPEATSAASLGTQNPHLVANVASAEASGGTNGNNAEKRPVSALQLSASESEAVPMASQSINDVHVQPNSPKIAGISSTPGSADADTSTTTRSTGDTTSFNESRNPQSSLLRNEDKIQILDIHTTNPLISFQKQLYSCSWTSTIGTDLLLTSPSHTTPEPVLRKTPSYDILAASGIKLIGRPVRLVSKEEERFNNERLNTALSSHLSDTVNHLEKAVNKVKPVTIPIDAGSSIGRQNQARFLERLIAIKAAKGERDSVTVYAQKNLTGTGWRAKQRADLEFVQSGDDMDSAVERCSPATQATAGRSPVTKARRGMGRGSGKTRAKGGLFRDCRPKLADEAGPSMMDGNLSTTRLRHESSGHSETFNQLDQDPRVRGIIPSAKATAVGNEGRESVDADMADASS